MILFLTRKSAAETKADDQPTNNNQQTISPPPAPAPNKGVDLKSDHHPDPATLQAYLETLSSKYRTGSPLALYATQIAESDYWALLIGICYIEQYHCTKAPDNAAWNFWGMGPGRKFASAEAAITYMDQYFDNLYPRRSTVQSLRGYYCASACTTWEPTVLQIKKLLEGSM